MKHDVLNVPTAAAGFGLMCGWLEMIQINWRNPSTCACNIQCRVDWCCSLHLCWQCESSGWESLSNTCSSSQPLASHTRPCVTAFRVDCHECKHLHSVHNTVAYVLKGICIKLYDLLSVSSMLQVFTNITLFVFFIVLLPVLLLTDKHHFACWRSLLISSLSRCFQLNQHRVNTNSFRCHPAKWGLVFIKTSVWQQKLDSGLVWTFISLTDVDLKSIWQATQVGPWCASVSV